MTMRPQQPDELDPLLLAFTLLGIVGLLILMQKRERSELRDQLRIARGRREELEHQARERESKLDGALETIKRLTDERDTGE